MALLRLPLSVPDGARVRVRVSLDHPTVLQLRQAGQAIPQPIDIDALIDPGAERTCIDPAVVTRLGLPLYAFGFTAAPGTGQTPVPIFGNVGVNTSHTAGVTVLHPSGPGHNLVIAELIVQALPLRPLGFDALIGRDVLGSCVLVYDGPGGSVTLAY
jgi:hypothetical protein